MYKLKRFSILKANLTEKLYALGVMKGKDLNSNKSPNGTAVVNKKWYPNNLGWIDETTGNLVTNFILLDYKVDSTINSDLAQLTTIAKKRFDILIDDLKRGFVFIDDDIRLVKNKSYKRSDPIWKGWDSRTHYLQDFQSKVGNDVLVYSKNLDEEDRLTYTIHRPKDINGVMTCEIKLNRAYKHMFGNEVYDEGDGKIEWRDAFPQLAELRDNMPEELMRKLAKGIIK